MTDTTTPRRAPTRRRSTPVVDPVRAGARARGGALGGARRSVPRRRCRTSRRSPAPTPTASSGTARSAPRCVACPGSRPSSKTSPRSSTGSCGSRTSSSSACTRRASRRTPRTRCASSPRSPRPPAPSCSTACCSGDRTRTPRPTSAAARRRSCATSSRRVGADTVIADTELAPSQRRALEDVVKVKVIDRTTVILDIFSQHAKSREGKAQVELAQLEYLLPRLRGWGDSMSRQAGGQVGAGGAGMGSRGPGETKIELDRRRIRTKMALLRRQIRDFAPARDAKRAERKRNTIPSVAIAGYTNAGKSSLLNRLTSAGVLVENALFATLDATVRRSETSDGRVYTLTDTVGFVRNLPHQLVEAFRSTLEEVGDADVIVHVVDAAHPDPAAQLQTVRDVIGDVGARDITEIVVFNKADLVDDDTRHGAARSRAARAVRLVAHRRGDRRAARGDRGRAAAAGRRGARARARTTAATSSRPPTSRGTSCRSRTKRAAPRCTRTCRSASPPNCAARSRSDCLSPAAQLSVSGRHPGRLEAEHRAEEGEFGLERVHDGLRAAEAVALALVRARRRAGRRARRARRGSPPTAPAARRRHRRPAAAAAARGTARGG